MSTRPVVPPTLRAVAALALATLALSQPLSAWALYKVVGPDGKVTYTDRPIPGSKARPLATGDATDAPASPLPYTVQQAANRYPVTLLTSKSCTPCQTGRDWLRARGIPFREMTVTTSDDTQALKRLTGAEQVPVLRIGSQTLTGFQADDWASYLDLAGYPSSSQLPSGYAWPEPAPLASGQATKAKPAGTEAPTSPTPSAPAAPPAEGTPPGFRF